MSFKTKELIFIALMSALLFIVNFSMGAGIIAVTGIPGGSAFITGITNLIVITFVALTLKKVGSLTLLYFIYGIIALPTPMAGGPPGFMLKIPLLALSAFLFEIVMYFSNYKKIGFILGLPVFTIFGFATYLLTYWFLGMPEFDKMYSAFLALAVIFIVLGYIGMWLGFIVHNRLKNKRILSQISA
ncbi:hypothetical protein HZA97_04075 [Candidatus Woesearchaeota archaeon]|nr:hypothetical protein [Candidatus Woesearchaeota archaeon]